MGQNERRFAVLIDVDNASPKCIKYILDEVSDVGVTIYKRTYGDWTDNEKRSWKNVPSDWSVNLIQQCSYTAGENAIDSAMIIDAMNILYSGNVDGFYLVSNDSDSTKLAQRLREVRMFVMGIGEQGTPEPFRVICDTFRLPKIISSDDTLETPVIENQRTITNIDEVRKAITKPLTEDNGQNQPIIPTGMGNLSTRRSPNFGVRNYGYPKLSTLLESLDNDDFQVAKLHGGYFAQEKSASISRTKTKKEIARITKEYNGHVDSLSIIYDEPKKARPSSDVKQYGFSHISSSIRSFRTFRIRDSVVQLKQRRQYPERGVQPVDESLSEHICLPISF